MSNTPSQSSVNPGQLEGEFSATAMRLEAAEPIIDSAALFRGQPAVFIKHCGTLYSLRQTRQQKLILTKP